MRVGTEPGYVYGDVGFSTDTRFTRIEGPDLDANIGKLLRNRLDVLITDRAVAFWTTGKMGIREAVGFSQPLFTDRLYAIFNKRPEVAMLVPSFESELRRVKQTPEYVAILRRYHQELPAQTVEQRETRAD